jgi:hypothetical protein
MTGLNILPRELQSARGDCEYSGFRMPAMQNKASAGISALNPRR